MGEQRQRLRPIVAFAGHPWVEPEWMNRQQLLSRLGKRGWPIAYSFGPLDWWQRGSAHWNGSPLFNRVEDRDAIRDIVPGRLGARWKRLPFFDRLATARHARFIRSTVARPDERIIALLFDPQFYPYIEHLQPCDVAFHAYDTYASQSGWTEERAAFQVALVKQAALITASSDAIARSLGDTRVKVLPNGADVEAFANALLLPEPEDLRSIPHPRLGYIGAINRKVDLALIATLARERTDWHWILVGRVERNELLSDDYNAPHFKACEALPNVHFLGQKDRRDVPAYVGHMDINTMCYRTNGDGWWTAISPLKLHEYLASGLPVISAPVESVMPFADVVRIVENSEQWGLAIEETLATIDQTSHDMRQSVAGANSWDTRIIQLEKFLHALNPW